MSQRKGVNSALSSVFAIAGIPVCLLAGYIGIFTFIYLIGSLETLFTTGLIDETLVGSLFFSLLIILCFVMEACFFRLSFGVINRKAEKRFWVFSVGLFSVFFIGWFFLVIKDHIFYSYSYSLLFFLAFYLVGSLYALINLIKEAK